MACWSRTPPRCTWCRLGWQVMTAPPPPPFCLFVTVCHICLSVCLGSLNHLWVLFKNKKKNKKPLICLHQTDFIIFSPLHFSLGVKYPWVSPHFLPPSLPPPHSFSIYMCGMVGSSQILKLVNAQSMLKLNNTFCKWSFMYRFIEKLQIKDLTESTIWDSQDQADFDLSCGENGLTSLVYTDRLGHNKMFKTLWLEQICHLIGTLMAWQQVASPFYKYVHVDCFPLAQFVCTLIVCCVTQRYRDDGRAACSYTEETCDHEEAGL